MTHPREVFYPYYPFTLNCYRSVGGHCFVRTHTSRCGAVTNVVSRRVINSVSLHATSCTDLPWRFSLLGFGRKVLARRALIVFHDTHPYANRILLRTIWSSRKMSRLSRSCTIEFDNAEAYNSCQYGSCHLDNRFHIDPGAAPASVTLSAGWVA